MSSATVFRPHLAIRSPVLLRLALVVWLSISAALPVVGSTTVAATSIDAGSYHQMLEEAVHDLQHNPQSAPDVAMRLRAIEEVTLTDGATVRPNLAPIIRDLEQRPDPARAIDQLEAVLQWLDRADAGRADHAAGDPMADLQQVLNRPEFHNEQDTPTWFAFFDRVLSPIRRAIERVRDWISDWFDRWLTGDGDLSDVVPLIGIVLIVGLLTWVALAVRRTVGRAVVAVAPESAQRRMSRDDARAEAERLARSGAFRQAIRSLYLAVLLHLDERAVIQFDRALTNHEVLLVAREQSRADLVGQLTPLVERFDRHWYGGAQCSADDYAEFSQLAHVVLEVS